MFSSSSLSLSFVAPITTGIQTAYQKTTEVGAQMAAKSIVWCKESYAVAQPKVAAAALWAKTFFANILSQTYTYGKNLTTKSITLVRAHPIIFGVVASTALSFSLGYMVGKNQATQPV